MGGDGPKSAFWAEGREALEAGLREAEERELAELSAKLGKIDDPARGARLLAEMEEVRSRYRAERRAARHALFSTAGVTSDGDRSSD